jgi:hypothetical protein
MLQQVYLDTAYADARLDDGTYVFSLLDPLTVPQGFTMQVRLLNAYLPHSYYSIFDGNDTLVLKYDVGGEIKRPPVIIKLPRGNRSIDNIVAFLNDGRLDEYVASYDENTNKLSLCTGRLLGALCQSSRIHLPRAAVAREYVYATDERGTKTPPAIAHVRDVYVHTVHKCIRRER